MYENITYEVILKRLLDRVPVDLDRREGSIIWDTLSPTSIELQLLYLELDNVLKESYGDTASRDYLIRRCKERGIAPYKATSAVLKGEFTPSNIDVEGQRFNIEELNYTVTKKITDGWEVECETAGVVGNKLMGTMIPVNYIDGLQTAKLTELLIPGEDEEDTEALRARYFKSFDEKAFGGNKEDYLTNTNAIPGVGSTKVTRVWNGDIHPVDMIPSAGVRAWYNSITGTLTDEVRLWLTSVYKAAVEKKLTTGGTVLLTILNSEFGIPSDTLVQTVQTEIDPADYTGGGIGLAPIGHVVSVKAAKGIDISVRTNISFDAGCGWDNMAGLIEEAVKSYLLALCEGWADETNLVVRISQIETRILNVSGVIDIRGTAVNGVSENLILGEYEVPIFKAVSG